MAKKSAKKNTGSVWGWESQSLVEASLRAEPRAGEKTARVQVLSRKSGADAMRVVEREDRVEMQIFPFVAPEPEVEKLLQSPPAVRARDAVGGSLATLEKMQVTWVEFDFDLAAPALEGALLGLELALYRFKRIFKNEVPKFGISLKYKGRPLRETERRAPLNLGQAVNLARHLTNLPPNLLNPVSYAGAAERVMGSLPNVEVEVWDEKRMARENMNLHLAVGQASATPPRLVHIRYRPRGAKTHPVAFVGKGVTFDSGGLDIKPSSGMRLMKKDMGGSAAVLALAYWVASQQMKINADFYLPLAENAVGSSAFRPGDVVVARNGQSVEIHNTDAEGRLLLADAMDVAVTEKEKPRILVDVATLTGAIKVALGAQVAGLFANDPKLGQSLAEAGHRAGDPVWVMPLVQRYRGQLQSNFADWINSSDGFGGAITAALFLEKFTRGLPWAHLDIYAWKDSSEGAWLESGGSGQAVQALADWIKSKAE